ncbi:MAG: MltA domain-containing protein [Pseudomonadota bacterium]
MLLGLSERPFSTLPGWGEEEAQALLFGVRRHFAPHIRSRPHQAPFLEPLEELLTRSGSSTAQQSVEAHFVPIKVPTSGFVTAYYEPIIAASWTPGNGFETPLYRRPDDLVRVAPRADLPGDGTWGRRCTTGAVVPYYDRIAIEAGALRGRGLELAYMADPVDAFFAQVQGSARLRFPDGRTVRVGYHGKSGHAYTAIGRVLIDRGVLPEGGATMATIREALASDPQLVAPTLRANRSFVFFREREDEGDGFGPVAAAGLPLIPWRSLAVDRAHIGLGTPVFVETTLPTTGPFHKVMIAEDTGSAIVGPARGDLFIGSGDAAGAIAGDVKQSATFTLILPRAYLEAGRARGASTPA